MEHTDILIVGGGIAGICAAIEALAAGRRVLLVDRDRAENLGGLARESFGGMFLVDTPEQRRQGLHDSPVLALEDWQAFAQFGADEHWPRAWAEAYVHRCTAEVGGWLRAAGVRYFPVPNWVERGLDTQGNSVPRFHMVWGTGQALTDRLIARLRAVAAGRLDLRFGLRVERLLSRDGRICGVAGVREDDSEAFELHAGAVIVASGGINGDLDRVRRHWHADWGEPPATLLNGSHRYADGRLHDAVGALGGAVTHLDRMWNYAAGVHHPCPRKPRHGLSLVPPRSALWLDARGARIGPRPLVTGFDTRDLVTQVCRGRPAHSWQLMNRRIALKELAVSGAEFNPSIRERRPLAFLRDLLFGNRWLYEQMVGPCLDFVTADTLPELVARMNALNGDDAVDPTAVRAAAEAYDAAIDRGPPYADEQLQRIELLRRWKGDRIRTCRFQKILDPRAGPLIAVREFIISRKSLGGIQTDLDCRVLDLGGRPIPGLYAAGEAAGFGGGGMHGLRALEGTFLGGCVLGGRIAGQQAARDT
ncbi:FAD-binding dehydrogenase [Pseudothauera nasutitermitis]|uniref:FAD-binding dehydrogenase n=1 Tax=Pseudothauera nasutitermitis TaxID=2565930 RepID=A0A4S4AT19_9RHOO|nr:FAD-binding dehydrogenase [Pseudothauera nasutitermitis]THF62309.1 FAD-binding dehydrogenase [Pseudothauera nasutitermitis]